MAVDSLVLSGEDWKSPYCRQAVAEKIEEAIQFSGVISPRPSVEIENDLFKAAQNSKLKYMFLVSKIVHDFENMGSDN